MAKNPIDIGAKIFKVIEELFGKAFARDMLGTRSNVVKPPQMDKNAPTGNIYSKRALQNNPGALTLAEDKIKQYSPMILANKNIMEQANFLENAENVLAIKKGEVKTTKETIDTSKEADIIDIGSGKKLEEEGIAVLKDKRGYPEGTEPGSTMAKAIDEVNTINQGRDETLKKAVDSFFGSAMGRDTMMEGKRRAVIRKILLRDDRINLTKDEFESLSNYNDLRGGGDTKMDPLELFNKYYVRDTNKLESLDAVIDVAENEVKAADMFLKDEAFDVKPVRESLDDEVVDIPDPDELAEGGRPGFSSGGIKFLKNMINKKFGKDTMTTADKVKVTDEMLFERDKKRLLEELQDYKDIAPKFYQRMELKIKYPGISDELIAKIMADDDPQRVAEVMATMDEAFKMMDKGMGTDEILNTFKKTPRTKNAGGGLNYLMGM